MGEARRERDAGEGAARGVGVAEEREDRVVVRGRRELDLAALGEPPPARDDLAHDPPLGGEDVLDVLPGVAAPLRGEGAEPLVVGEGAEAHPGEVEVELQVRQLLVAERRGDAREVHRSAVAPALLQQVPVSWRGADVPLPVDHEERAQDRLPLLRPELRDRTRRELEEPVPGAARHVLLELLEEHRREVHGAAHARVAIQDPRHVVVGAGRVEAHPGHEELARLRLLVGRLVHVPEEGEADLPHRGCGGGVRRASGVPGRGWGCARRGRAPARGARPTRWTRGRPRS